MKYLFHLGHPAHFHLFKNVIKALQSKGNECFVAIKKKDILEELLVNSKIPFYNILPAGRKDNKLSIALGVLKQDYSLYKLCKKLKPDLLVGTSVAIAHVGKFLKIPSINVQEDDTAVVPLHAKLAYPTSTYILAPDVCDIGQKYNKKKIEYNGYHELAYLHPNHFKPSQEIASKYIDTSKHNLILRFVKLNAHHDDNVKGLSSDIAKQLIEIFEKIGQVHITSERELEKDFEKYRLKINPLDIHHVMAFSSFYIGDSQTMAAEAGVLGIPFIRINDFVGRIGYLNDLELNYELGYGFLPHEASKSIEKLTQILSNENFLESYKTKQKKMLNEKIDFSELMVNLFGSYPENINSFLRRK